MNPLVSVVIPCYNREKYIIDAIDSVLDQTYPNIEIVVVDDGSTDGSVGVVREYGDAVKLVCQSNGGANSARNTDLRESSGDLMVFLDSDDWLSSDLIRCHVETSFQFPEAGIFCAGAAFVRNGIVSKPVSSKYPPKPLRDLELAFLQPPPFPACEMFRRSVVELGGGFDEEMKAFTEASMRLKAILCGTKMVRTLRGYAIYRPVENSITRNSLRLHKYAVKLVRLLGEESKGDAQVLGLLRKRLLGNRLRYWNEYMAFHLDFSPLEIGKLLWHLLKVAVVDHGFILFVLREKPWTLDKSKAF